MSFIHLAIAVAVSATPSEQDKAKARSSKDQAFQKIAEGSYAEGVALLRRAHDAVPHPNFLFNIAVVYDQWPGHCAESLAAFDEFFEACADCEVKSTAEARVEKVRARCLTQLSVSSTPSGAALQVDDENRGTTPATLRLRPGPHALSLDAEGYDGERRQIHLRAGRPEELSIDLQPRPSLSSPAAPRRRPGAGLRTAGWAALGVGALGSGLGVAFTVMANDAVNEERALRATPGVAPQEVQDARSRARDNTAFAYVGYGVGIAGVASGVALQLLSAAKARNAPLALSTDGRRLLLSGRF